MSDPLVDRKSRPDFRSSQWHKVKPSIDLFRDVCGGTKVMREKGKTYLPKEPLETEPNYKIRLDRSVLLEATKRTRESLVGIVFKKDIVLGDDIPSAIKTQLEDVDLCGNHIDVFAKRLFTDQFEGYAFILVEMEEALPLGSTLADERNANRRPYWVKYKADQVINWRLVRINGRQEFSQITFEEVTTEPEEEYGESEVTRCRTFKRENGMITWKLNRIDKTKPEQEQVIFESSGIIQGVSRIPVAVIGEIGSQPPLLGLADVNISHFQNSSDQENILHITRVPMLCRTGISKAESDAGVVVGISGTMDLGSEMAKVFWLEVQHEGAMAVGRDHLLDIEQRMGMMGLSTLTQKQNSQITATEKRQDYEEKHSELSTMARSLKDGIELALSFHAEYLKAEQGGSIELGVAEDQMMITPQHMNILLTALTSGKLSLETFLTAVLNLLENAGILAEDVTVADEIKRIDAATQANQALGLAQNLNPNGAPKGLGSMVTSGAVQ